MPIIKNLDTVIDKDPPNGGLSSIKPTQKEGFNVFATVFMFR
jgi:hypothetical protein